MRGLRTALILSSLFLIFSATAVDAKTGGRLTVNVKSISGNPLQDALIKIIRKAQQDETVLVTRADSRGFFKSSRLSPGIYYLEVSSKGYEPADRTKFTIDPGQTTTLEVILQEFLDYIDKSEDARNWDFGTVMRSTSDRRLIFRNLPGTNAPVMEDQTSRFNRSGSMSIVSGTAPNGSSYLFHPQTSANGVTTSFAYAEPLSRSSRMILSGQMDFGSGTFWRLRDTFNYRPDPSHDYRVSVGYGRANVNYDAASAQIPVVPNQAGFRESGMETLAFGMEGNTRLLDLFAIKYGLDYSRLHYGNSKSFLSPYLQIVITPSAEWSIRTSVTSQRGSDDNTLVFSDGERLDLSEPTLITLMGNQATMSQIRHSEIAALRTLGQDMAIEFAVFQDRIDGPGLPIMVTAVTPLERRSQIMQINEDISGQRGTRFTLSRKLIDNLSGSVAYVYGTSASVYDLDGLGSADCLSGKLSSRMKQSVQHSITGRLNATIPLTKTNLLAVVRWYPGSPLIPADWFSDKMNIGAKSANLEIRQAIPFPDIMGTSGQWDVWIDLRNILFQGRETLPVNDGDVILNHNPRSLRFGLNLNFN
jgi:hypothetical protein